jgi:hypothetical protein
MWIAQSQGNPVIYTAQLSIRVGCMKENARRPDQSGAS